MERSAQTTANVSLRLFQGLSAILVCIALSGVASRAFAGIEGYLSAFSMVQGGTINLHVSADTAMIDAQVFRVDVQDRLVLSLTGVPAAKYSLPPQAWTNGAQWSDAVTLAIPGDWSSGLYRISLSASGLQSIDLNFVVREDRPGSHANILVLDNATTTVAYNSWGGKSTYTFNSTDGVFAPRVSLRRPGNHTALPQELEFARWARAMEIPVEYASMLDLHSEPDLLDHYTVVVLVGHSEYWSKEMRDRFEAFLSRGGNALILSGNTMWWQVRIEGDQLVCYKFAQDDPLNGIDNSRVTVNWYAAPVLRPEDAVTGTSWRHGGYVNASGFYPAIEGWGGYTVVASNHWLFQGTDLHDGDIFGREHTIVGYETDGALFDLINGNPVANGIGGGPLNFEILATAPAKTNAVRSGNATLGIFQTTGGGRVFNAATVDWADGLWSASTADIADRKVSAITYNALAAFSGLPPLIPTAPATVQASSVISGVVTVVWSEAAGYQVDYELEQATSAEFSVPTVVYRGDQTGVNIAATVGDAFFYRVRACSEYGCSAATAAPNSVVVEVPNPSPIDSSTATAPASDADTSNPPESDSTTNTGSENGTGVPTRKAERNKSRYGASIDPMVLVLYGVFYFRRRKES